MELSFLQLNLPFSLEIISVSLEIETLQLNKTSLTFLESLNILCINITLKGLMRLKKKEIGKLMNLKVSNWRDH